MASYSLLTAGSQGAAFSNTGLAASGGSNAVTLPTLFSSNATFTGPITLSNAVTRYGAETGFGPLVQSNVAAFSNTVSFVGPVTLSNAVTRYGAETGFGPLTQSNVAAFSNTATFVGPVTLSNAVTRYGDETAFGALTQSNVASFSNVTKFVGPVTLSNTVSSYGTFTQSNNATVYGAVTIGSNVAASYPLAVWSASNNVSIYANYDIAAFSDERVKTNLARIEDGMAKVSRISGYTYNRVEDPAGERLCGLLAQELQQVLPEAVHSHPETGYLSVSYGNVASLFVEALKDLKADVESLKAEVAALKAPSP